LTTLICNADLHVNSTVGLCPPGVELDDGGTYRPSQAQRWLWRNWLELWERVGSIEGRKVGVVCGDVGELDTKRRSVQLISANKATIIKMVTSALEPMLAVVDQLIIIRGTPAHTGKGSWLEESVAEDLDNVIRDASSASHYHARITIDGVRLDIAHHAPMGRQPWARNTGANTLASKTLWYYRVGMHKPPPHLVIRAHNHQAARGYAEDGGDCVEVRYLPAWTLATEFVFRSGYENVLADVGGLIVHINEGAYACEPVMYPYKTSEGQLWQTI